MRMETIAGYIEGGEAVEACVRDILKLQSDNPGLHISKLPDSADIRSVVMIHTTHTGHTTTHVGSWEDLGQNQAAWLSDDEPSAL